jgi:hypothetical protein
MEKLNRYKQIVLQIIDKYSAMSPDHVEVFKVLDHERDHYLLMRDGWWNSRRFYGCVIHFDIQDGKIWIRHDGIEHGIAYDLVEYGVPREDIVLAFHPPDLRHSSDFYDELPEATVQAMAKLTA